MNPKPFTSILILLAAMMLAGCGPGQFLGPTVTPSPTNMLVPTATWTPTFTSTITPVPTFTSTTIVDSQTKLRGFPIELSKTCQPGSLNFYGPEKYNKNVGKIDGYKFYQDATALTGDNVEITAIVAEAEFYSNFSDNNSGTLVLVFIPNTTTFSPKYYAGVIFLPGDVGMGVTQFQPHSKIDASGLHIGLAAPPANLFTWFPNTEGYQLASMIAVMASGGCQ